LNIKWREGKLQSVDILSRAGKDCLLRYKDKIVAFTTENGKTYKFDGNLELLK